MQEAGYAVVRYRHLTAVVGTFLMGCAVLLVVGCAEMRSEAPKEQGHAEVTKEQAHSDRCEGTRTIHLQGVGFVTNDVSGCPKGGLLSGTDGRDKLDGEDGDDEIRGLGAIDGIRGGLGSDVIYGGDGNDLIDGATVDEFGQVVRKQRDELYCGKGEDHYHADKLDYVDSSCEEKTPPPTSEPSRITAQTISAIAPPVNKSGTSSIMSSIVRMQGRA